MKELMEKIGKIAQFSYREMVFDVEVVDVRKMFDRTDYQVKPVSGSGESWISETGLKFKESHETS